MADSPITFLASFPPIQTAIKRSGDGGGMRIQLDIPESEMARAVLLLAMTNVVLRVTVEKEDRPLKNNTDQSDAVQAW